jgi:sulfite exporter TauE/SafE
MRVESVVSALFAGVATGAHCAVMCGPLACAFRVRPFSYHSSRLLSYSLAGAFCGLLGQVGRMWFESPFVRGAPWALLLVLVLMATGIERRFPLPAFFQRFVLRARLQGSLGLVSPLIPCGPLWLMLGVAAATGGAIDGAALLFCFSAGTVVLYVPLLLGWARVQENCTPVWRSRLRFLLLWGAVGLMAWRLSNDPSHGCCRL